MKSQILFFGGEQNEKYYQLLSAEFALSVLNVAYHNCGTVLDPKMGWLGETKVSCILRHRCVQLILAYSWERSAILAAGKGRGGMFLFFLFLHFHFPFFPGPLFHLLYYLFYLSSPFLWETTQNDPQRLHVIKPQHSQSKTPNEIVYFLLN